MATKLGETPTISGHLGTIAVQDVMGFLATTNQGGALEIESPDGELTLYLEGSAVVGGKVGRGGVDTAAMLLRRGQIGTDDLDAVRGRPEQGDLYSALLATGRLAPAEVDELVTEELSENLFRLFSWTPGEFRFHEGSTPPPDVRPVRIEIQGLLFEAALRCGGWDGLPSIYADEDTRFELRALPRADEQLALGLEHWKLLYLVTNRRRLADLWRESPLGSRFETSRTLFGLASARLIQPAGSSRRGDGSSATRAAPAAAPAPPELRCPGTAAPAGVLSVSSDTEPDTQPVLTRDDADAAPPRAGRFTRAQIDVAKTPRLVQLGAGEKPRVFPLAGDTITLGRSAENTLVLPDAHVSSRHARLLRDGDGFEIEDTQSSNGIRVNGRKLLRSSLQGGEEIEIFPYRFRFEVAFEICENG